MDRRGSFHKMSSKEMLVLSGLIVVNLSWLAIDQYFFPELYQRIIALSLVMTCLMVIQFYIVAPEKPKNLSNTILLCIQPVVVLTSLTIHLLIKNDLAFRSVILWMLTPMVPYLSGYIYSRLNKVEFRETQPDTSQS